MSSSLMLSFSFPFPLLLYLLGALFTKIGKYRLFCSLFGLHVTFGSVHMQILNMALNRLTEKPHLYCHNTLDSVKRANALTHTPLNSFSHMHLLEPLSNYCALYLSAQQKIRSTGENHCKRYRRPSLYAMTNLHFFPSSLLRT